MRSHTIGIGGVLRKIEIPRRLTTGNSFAAHRAARVTQTRSRAIRPLCGFAPPHLGQGTFATQSPITCPKRQLPETLYDNFFTPHFWSLRAIHGTGTLFFLIFILFLVNIQRRIYSNEKNYASNIN